MKILKKQFLILFIIFWLRNSSCFFKDLLSITKTLWTIIGRVEDFPLRNSALDEIVTVMLEGNGNITEGTLEQLNTMQKDLQDFRIDPSDKSDSSKSLIKGLLDEIQINAQKQSIALFIAENDDKWNSFLTYVKEIPNNRTLHDFAFSIIEQTEEFLRGFRDLIAPSIKVGSLDQGLFMLISKNARPKRDTLCDEGETYHHVLVHALQIALVTEIKAALLLSFANRWLYAANNAWTWKVARVKNQSVEYFEKYTREFTKAMKGSDYPYIRACDPKSGSWEKGETFLELEGLLQWTIYHSSPYRCCTGFEDGDRPHPLNTQTSCGNSIRYCEHYGGRYDEVSVCIYSEGPFRIQWIEGPDGLKGRKNSSCPEKNLFTYPDETWQESLPFCRCQCASRKWRILLQPKTSRVWDNYVVVGMRLQIDSDVLFIQIAEGKLEANGYISNFTWATTGGHALDELNQPLIGEINVNLSTIFFSDAYLPPGYVLTGINFYEKRQKNLRGFGISLEGHKFDYKSGKLNLTTGVTSRRKPATQLKELPYMARNSLHMNTYEPHNVDSDGYTHVILDQSIDDDDFGQSTLPLFDSIPVLPSPLSPIGGVGIFHKGYRDHAGFIALRLFPIDYLYYVSEFLKTQTITAVLDD